MQTRSVAQFLAACASLLFSGCTSPPSTIDTDSAAVVMPPRGTEVPARPIRLEPAKRDPSDRFPRPPELEPQIAFWRNVYGTWSRSQAVVHDDRYLNVVYEVIRLPGEIGDSYSAQQKEVVDERRDYWRNRLSELERYWSLRLPLSADDRRLVSQLESNAPDHDPVLGAAERVRVQRGLRERFKRGLEISVRYEETFRRIFREAGLPEDLAYLPHVESSFQSSARSSAGAVGIWQFTRSAAERFMTVNEAIDERLDPIASARGAARYLSHARGKLASWPLTLTSYNHGIAGMQRARDAMGDDFVRIVQRYDHPKFGFASRNFYAEFLAAREVASNPQRFFPEGVRYDHPATSETVSGSGMRASP